MSRRHSMLMTAAATVGGMLAPANTQAVVDEERRRPLQLGFSLYGMKTLSLDAAIRTCAEIGYSNVELCLNAGYPTEPRVLTGEQRLSCVELLKSTDLSVPCLMIHLSLTADDATHKKNLGIITTAGELSHQLGQSQPPFLETVLGGSPEKWDQQKAGMLRQLRDWAATAQAAGTMLALKAHVGSAVNSPERLNWLIDHADSASLCVAFDFSHFELQGMDLESSLDALLPRTKFIHVKDTAGDAGKFQFLLPGEGRTDYVSYFGLLKARHYSGPVCVEVSGQISNQPDYDPVKAAKQSFDVLSDAMEKS
ncbi:MAG: sugar phosphate isomerase/epimerase family protein, partial [Planctomycetota bacterium]